VLVACIGQSEPTQCVHIDFEQEKVITVTTVARHHTQDTTRHYRNSLTVSSYSLKWLDTTWSMGIYGGLCHNSYVIAM